MLHRKALYTGVFLVTAGAVMLLTREVPARDVVADALGLWPLAVIAIGVALILRRTRLGLAGGLIAAALPGLLLGGVVVAAPAITPGCDVVQPSTTATTTRDGSFGEDASVRIDLDCGDLTITTVPGRGWTLEAGSIAGSDPVVEAAPDRLRIASSHRRSDRFTWAGETLTVALPRDVTMDLVAEVNAGRGRLDLTDGRYRSIGIEANATDARIDLTGSTLDRLTLDANAAATTLILPSGSDLTASIDVNAASAVICAPPGLGLRITETTVLGDTTFNGLVRNGSAWQSPDYGTATYRADMSVSVNVGSVVINPEGDCK